MRHCFYTGRPATPTFGDLLSGPNVGDVTMMINTRTSGIDGTFQLFGFFVFPILDGTEGDSIPYLFPNYQSGTFETIVVSGLEEGESYMFNATAINMFGNSEAITSDFVLSGIYNTNT